MNKSYRESSKPLNIKISLTCAEVNEAIRDFYVKKGGTIPAYENASVKLLRPDDPSPPWDWDKDIWLELVITENKK